MATVDLRQSTIFSRLRGLLEVTRLIRTSDDVPDLLTSIAETVADSLGFRCVVVNLYRREWDDFLVTTVHGSDEARSALLGQVRQIDDWVPLLDQRFLQRGAYLVPNGEFDWSAHTAYTPDLPVSDDPSAWHPEDALFAPLRTSDGELIGILSVDDPVSGRRPTGDEIDVLVAVTDHAAIAVQAAQEAARAKANSEALARLLEVSARLNQTSDTQELLDLVCAATAETLAFERVAVQLLQPDGCYVSVAEVGFEGENVGPPLTARQLDNLLRPEYEVEGAYLIPSDDAIRLLPGREGGYRSKLNGRGTHAWRNHWLLVPFRDAAGSRAGYLWADDPVDRLCPDAQRLRILCAFANQAATALAQAERTEALRERSEYHRALIEASPVAIVDFDLDGRVRSWSAAAAQMFGWSAEETIGRFSPIVPAAEAGLFRANLELIKEGATLRDLDFQRMNADGTTVDVIVSAGPVRDAHGEITGVVAMMVDVSERRASERALAESEARKDAILRAAPEAVVVVDAAGLVVETNPAAEEILGWTRSEAMGHPFLSRFVAVGHREELAAALDAGAGPLLGIRHEVQALRSDGTPFAAELRITTVEMPGDPLFAIALDDVSKRREREQRLRDAEAKYRTLVEHLPLATYVNEIGNPVRTSYMSPQIETILGYPVSDWGQPDWFPTLLHPQDRERVLAALERTHLHGEPFHAEYRLRSADGRWVWVLDETVAVRDAEYRPIFLQGFLIDVTERHAQEEELRASQELYRTVVETSHDLIVVADLDGRILYVSPRTMELLGYASEEFLGTAFGDLVDPADLPAVHGYLERRLAGDEDAIPPRSRVFRKDGGQITLEGVISILQGEDGEPQAYVSVSRVVQRAALRSAAA